MNILPPDFDISFLIGDELMQVCIGLHQKEKNRTGTFLCNFFAKSIVSTTVVIYSLTGVDMYDPGKKKAY